MLTNEIEENLKNAGGDMLKIEYLENCLKKISQNDIRRFCHINLADLYSKRSMLQEAGKNLRLAADAAVTYNDKMILYMEAAKMWIKQGDYYTAEEAFKKATISANNSEKEKIKQEFKQEMIRAAEALESQNKNSHAVKAYEKAKTLVFITPEETNKINSKLIPLYNKIGKIRESIALEQQTKK